MIFTNPVKGTIYLTVGARFYRSQAFGCTGFSWEPRLGSCAHFHRAIDVSHGDGACGKDVVAPAAGTVIYVGRLNDGSDAIVLRHAGGYATGYGHTKGTVSKGQKVAKGQKIGDMNQSGVATGCHVHFAMKSGFPLNGDVNDFWLDAESGSPQPGGEGRWIDPWPRLEQNVKVHPKEVANINIRLAPTLGDNVYATTDGDLIHRAADGASLGGVDVWRRWGGRVSGASYSVGGKTGNTWERIDLGGMKYIATPLAVLSAT